MGFSNACEGVLGMGRERKLGCGEREHPYISSYLLLPLALFPSSALHALSPRSLLITPLRPSLPLPTLSHPPLSQSSAPPHNLSVTPIGICP